VVLRTGILMQSGTPQEIHDRPKNVFVADFMGFRNFFKVRIASVSDGIAEGVGDGIRIRARAGDDVSAGADMVMAIRPDDIRAGGEVVTGDADVTGSVEVVEYLGREQEAAIRINDNTRVWLRTAQAIRSNDTIGLQFPIDKVVLLPAE
jgi:putative spermidine/putrescine transport system ATP-binding protein